MCSTVSSRRSVQVRKRTGNSPDLFAFCLGGTLVAIALAWLAAKKQADEVNSATLIGSLVDFADMRDWSAFVHEGPSGRR
jgi:polyhydroxyalkanoate synthase